jgi:hypothetical protein
LARRESDRLRVRGERRSPHKYSITQAPPAIEEYLAAAPTGQADLIPIKSLSSSRIRELQDIKSIFKLDDENEHLCFQCLARPSKYFRTVSSTLVTPTRVTCSLSV